MKTIEIIVTQDGKTTVRTARFRGSSCRDASRFIEQAVGKTQSERLTTEFYQVQAVQENQRQRS
jgi:hypothetical protein